MTKPDEPKIQINPESKEGLEEWLEVKDVGDDMMTLWHYRGGSGVGLFIARRDLCTLADWVGAYLWKEDELPAEAEKPIGAESA
jgi:hypothetical protein